MYFSPREKKDLNLYSWFWKPIFYLLNYFPKITRNIIVKTTKDGESRIIQQKSFRTQFIDQYKTFKKQQPFLLRINKIKLD